MRTITCEQCGHIFPDRHLSCPECGSRGVGLEKWRRAVWVGLKVVLIGFFVIMMLGALAWLVWDMLGTPV